MLGISVPEFVHRAVQQALAPTDEPPWMKCAGDVDCGDPHSSQHIDDLIDGPEEAPRMECYVDRSALIAFRDRADSHHSRFRRLFSARPPLATSALVVAEGDNWLLPRYHQHQAIQFPI